MYSNKKFLPMEGGGLGPPCSYSVSHNVTVCTYIYAYIHTHLYITIYFLIIHCMHYLNNNFFISLLTPVI